MAKNHIKHFIPIFCIFLYTFAMIAAALPIEDQTRPTPSSLVSSSGPSSTSIIDPSYDKQGARYLFTISFAIMQLNAIGSIYVLYRTFLKYRSLDKKSGLSMALRVPFYIAVSDLNLYVVHMVNQGYTLVNEHTWEGYKCKVVGGIVFFQVAANMTLVGTIALVTYLRVCRRIPIDLGPYDRNFFAVVIGLPLILTLCSIPSFGPSTYWCYTNKTNHIMPIITLILTFSVLTLNSFCYYLTLRELKKSKSKLAVSTESALGGKSHLSENSQRLERRVTRKIATYILMFSVQWTPAMPYVVASVFSSATPSIALYILCDIAINLGGIGNGIQYIINEGWRTSSTPAEGVTDDHAKTRRRHVPSVIYVTQSVSIKSGNNTAYEISDSLCVEREAISTYSQETMVVHEGAEENCKD